MATHTAAGICGGLRSRCEGSEGPRPPKAANTGETATVDPQRSSRLFACVRGTSPRFADNSLYRGERLELAWIKGIRPLASRLRPSDHPHARASRPPDPVHVIPYTRMPHRPSNCRCKARRDASRRTGSTDPVGACASGIRCRPSASSERRPVLPRKAIGAGVGTGNLPREDSVSGARAVA